MQKVFPRLILQWRNFFKNLTDTKLQRNKLVFILLGLIVVVSLAVPRHTHAANTYWIYGSNTPNDNLAPGWTTKMLYAVGSDVNLNNQSPYYIMPPSLAYTVRAPQDELFLIAPSAIAITAYKYLAFVAQASSNVQNYQVWLLNSAGQNIPNSTPLSFNNYGGPLTPPGQWIMLNFPLSAFNAGTTQIYGIGIQDVNGGAQPPVYLSEIGFSDTQGQNIQPATPSAGIAVSPAPTTGPVMPYYPDISPWIFIIPGVILFAAIFFE